jgi:hypothetical protein
MKAVYILLCAAMLLLMAEGTSWGEGLKPAEEAFLQKLMSAPDSGARRAVMEENRALVTEAFIDEILNEAIRIRGKREEALRLCDFALDLSEFLGDQRETAWCYLQAGQVALPYRGE